MVSNIDVKDVEDIFEIRKLLEPLAANDSLPRMSISELKEIKKDSEKLMAKPENRENIMRFFVLDEVFHKFLNKECRKKKLIDILNCSIFK